MTYPVTSGTSLVQSIDYNSLYDIVEDVFAVNEEGWGLYAFYSTPISSNNLIRASQWRNLEDDLIRLAYFHITNTTTVLTSNTPIVSGSLIEAERQNQLKSVADYVLANRYTCAEGQYYRDPITGATVNTTDGVSRRTLEWGITENYIEHRVRVRWANRLIALHFFNTGGILTWTPYHSNNGLNDIDSEWAAFINSVRISQETQPIAYDRNAFLAQTAGTTATIYAQGSSQVAPNPTYQSGTLSINVELFKSNGEDWVEFIITFANANSAELVVTPSVGYWNYTV